jgi:hypothetical protein
MVIKKEIPFLKPLNTKHFSLENFILSELENNAFTLEFMRIKIQTLRVDKI